MDKQNGNDEWTEAVKKELKQLNDCETFIDKGSFNEVGVPTGCQLIKVMWAFAVKHDGRHEACLEADGNLTAVPLNLVCTGVVSLRGLRMVSFPAERNGLKTWAADIGNACLEARTHEKVCIKAGRVFGPLEGHLSVIQAALHGSCSVIA